MEYGDRPAAAEAEPTKEVWKALETPRPLEPPAPFADGVPPELPADPGESEGPVIAEAVGVIDAELGVSPSFLKFPPRSLFIRSFIEEILS